MAFAPHGRPSLNDVAAYFDINDIVRPEDREELLFYFSRLLSKLDSLRDEYRERGKDRGPGKP